MLFGRFAMKSPCWPSPDFSPSGSRRPKRSGTFPVTSPLFVALLLGVILIVTALTFFPALALGPIVEHLLMQAGHLF